MADFRVPAGFAATVAGDLLQRARAYNAEHLSTWSDWVAPRVALMTELAVVVAGRGERDDLLAALASFDNGRWNPGRRVENLIADEVLVIPEPGAEVGGNEDRKRCERATAQLPNANKLLHRLVAAHMGDVVETARQIRDRAAAELAAAQPDARIESLEMRVAVAERAAAEANAQVVRASASEERMMRENGLLRSELRHLAEMEEGIDADAYVNAVLAGPAPEKAGPSVAPVEEPHDPSLPKGIRPRDNGRFHAYLTRAETADNKQRGVGTYDTVEEAVSAREEALAEEAAKTEQVVA